MNNILSIKIALVPLCLSMVGMIITSCTGRISFPPLTLEQLRNTEYQLELPADGKAKLKNGFYREQIVPNSATQLEIWLDSLVVFGDLNDDAVADAAAILVGTAGGSGAYYYLVAVINHNGKARHAATQSLGDRVIVKSLKIQSGKVIVRLTKHGPGDALCCPTLEGIQIYQLNNETLDLIGEHKI
jgi:hypothetical protein